MAAKPLLKLGGAVLAAGLLFGVGVRISQWLVPAPPVRVALCDSASAGEDSCLVIGDDMDAPADQVDLEQAPSPAHPTSQRI